jgi:hypothetical protein
MNVGERECTVAVAARVRPLSAVEAGEGCETAVVAVDGQTVMIGAERSFGFTHVFGAAYGQQQLYDECVQPLVLECMRGYNATVFAYGQTVRARNYAVHARCC